MKITPRQVYSANSEESVVLYSNYVQIRSLVLFMYVCTSIYKRLTFFISYRKVVRDRGGRVVYPV